MKIVFAGTPRIVIPVLNVLKKKHESQFIQLDSIITQPDTPQGRGLKLTPSPVKEWALENNFPVLQPENINETTFIEKLRELQPDILLVFAYSQFLKQTVLDLPRWGCYNIHTSLLPRWRGASPIHHAILHGDKTTGVSLQKMVLKMDAGPIVSSMGLKLDPDWNFTVLSEKLSFLSAQLIESQLPWKSLPKYTEQIHENSIYAHLIQKQDAFVHSKNSAQEIYRKMLAFSEWPGVKTIWKNFEVKILDPAPFLPGKNPESEIGKLLIDNFFQWKLHDGTLIFKKIQLPNQKALEAKDVLNGRKMNSSEILGVVHD